MMMSVLCGVRASLCVYPRRRKMYSNNSRSRFFRNGTTPAQKRTGGAPAIDSTHRMVYHAYLLVFDSTHRMVYYHVYLLVLHPPASIIAAVPPWLVLLYHNNTIIYYGVLTHLHRTFQYNLFGIPSSAAPLPFFKGDAKQTLLLNMEKPSDDGRAAYLHPVRFHLISPDDSAGNL